MMSYLPYMILSVCLGTGRNIISKKNALATANRSDFFLAQAILFAAAALLVIPFGWREFRTFTSVTLVCGILFGILLVLAQWMLTLALKSGPTSVCSVVYALGFIIPTVSGTLFWKEPFSRLNGVGVCLSVIVILLTVNRTGQGKASGFSFVPFILTAMLASGGLGIMQKVQQSVDAGNMNMFVFIASMFAFCCSLLAFFCQRCRSNLSLQSVCFSAATGFCFSGLNMCNTYLAGRMKSAVFFPVYNVSVIVVSTALGTIVFREKFTAKIATILGLGILVILLFCI